MLQKSFDKNEKALCLHEVGISDALVLEALDRILASSPFAGSPRLRKFLRYAVENTINGDFTGLKEVCVGIHVFGKTPSYDPKTEPIVRVEARRLRSRLCEYYSGAGRLDPIEIMLPKGGYQTAFSRRSVDMTERKEHQSIEGAIPEVPLILSASSELPTRAGKLRITLWILAAAVFVGFLTGLGSVLLARFNRLRPLEFSKVVPLVADSGADLQPSISHDGKQVAFVSGSKAGGNYDIYVKLIDVGTAVRLTTDPAADLGPQWSPDDRFIAFERLAEGSVEIYVIPALGGAERKVTQTHIPSSWKADALQAQTGSTPAWTSDGSALIVTDQDGAPGGSSALFLVPLDGSPRRRLTFPTGLTSDGNAVMAHDGRHLAFVRETTNSSSDLFVAGPDGTKIHQITFDRMRIRGLAWAPDDRSLIFASNRSGAEGLWQVATNGGGPTSIATKGDEVTSPSLASDASILAYTATTQISTIWRLPLGKRHDIDPVSTVALIASNGRNHSARYSPDGLRIVFVSDRSGSWEIWVSDSEGTNVRQVTHFAGPMVGTPHWSPDSQKLAFDSRPAGRSVVYTVALDGSQLSKVIDDGFEDKKPNWSRDGQSLYYTSNKNGTSQLWKSGVHGERPVQFTKEICNDSAESIDGKTVYFQTNGNGLYRMPASGGPAEIVKPLSNIRGDRYFDVSEGIYFLKQDGTAKRIIELYEPLSGISTAIGTISGQLVYGTPSLSVSPDHRHILYAQEDRISSQIMTLRR
jgi:Tol biopolymer transport system component